MRLEEIVRSQRTRLFPFHEVKAAIEGEDHWSHRSGGPGFSEMCHREHIFQVLSTEFVEDLVNLLMRLSGQQWGEEKKVLEVMAGTGHLARYLNEVSPGLVHPTDGGGKEYTAYHKAIPFSVDVEKLDWYDAVQKYKPSVVLACWVPYEYNLWDQLMSHFTFVRYGVDIGEGPGGCTGVHGYDNVELEWDTKASRYALARTDYPGGCHHTGVHVVRRLTPEELRERNGSSEG